MKIMKTHLFIILFLLTGAVNAQEWITPTNVTDFSCDDPPNNGLVSNSFDDNVSTCWGEFPLGDVDGSTYEWYVTYNLGQTGNISKIRLYADGDQNLGPCKVGSIKVCNDSACVGESNLLSSDCTFSSALTWHECSFTPTQGQYIEVKGGVFSDTCKDKDDTWCMIGLLEFDGYIATTTTTSTTTLKKQVMTGGRPSWWGKPPTTTTSTTLIELSEKPGGRSKRTVILTILIIILFYLLASKR